MAKPRSEKYLLAGETVHLQTRRHWAIVLRPMLEAAGALLVTSILFGWTGSNVVTGAGFLFVMFLAFRLSWRIADWRVANLYLTDWRIFEISGLVTQRIAAMPLRKITDLTYETPPFGRIVGYGRFIIETAGQDQAFSRLDYIPDARRLYQLLSHLTLHGAAPSEAGADPTVDSSEPPDDSEASGGSEEGGSRQRARAVVTRLFGGDYESGNAGTRRPVDDQ